MALDGAKFVCLSDVAAADATESTPTTTTGVEAGGIGDDIETENKVIEAKGRIFTIGYYMNCDYVLEDPRAIGVHCEIQCDAFGRVTIHNNSDAHPISVNEQIITLKRPLLDGSRIKILDRNFLWKFPKPLEVTATSKSTQGDDVTCSDLGSTPQKLVAVPEQAPNSCPDLKHHRKVDKRFTVHNFAYCINSDEEGNTSSELPSKNESEILEEAETSKLVTRKESNKNEEMSIEGKDILPTSITSQDRAIGKTTLETSNFDRRSITPEPQKNEPNIASTPLIKLEDTPKMNLINCTKNKENRSTEKKLRILSFCTQSDVVITSFSPRETGVRIEKSFTAVVRPATLGSITPKSVYSTPKNILSGYSEGESLDFIDFNTPATSKKPTGRLARNSSMHLIDLTTPSKLAPDSARRRLAHKGNKTVPSHEKLSTTPISSDKLKDDSATLGTQLNKSESSPQSAELIINVDETSDSSTGVIEISTDSPASIASSPFRTGFIAKTPQRQKPLTSTPLRTPQSLLKRAIVTSAKKQINSSLRAALSKATPTRQLTSTTAHNKKLNTTDTVETTPSTPKSRIFIGSPGSVSAAQRRNATSLTQRSSLATSINREHAFTPSSTSLTRFTQNRKIPASESRLNTLKSTAPLRGVRKSLGGTTLTSHISKTRRSVISPRKHSPTSIAAKLASKARKSFIPNSQNRKQVASRARSLVVAAVSSKNSTSGLKTSDTTTQKKDNVQKMENITGKEVKNKASLEDQNEVDDLSRTFTVDDSLEEVQIKSQNPSTPCVLEASTSLKQDLNKTFSPEESLKAVECKVVPDVTVDTAEISTESHREHISEDSNDEDKIILSEHISESFGEVVDAVKTEEKIKSLKALVETVKVEQQNYTVDEISKISASASEQQQNSKSIEEQVIETLDAGEVSGDVSVEQKDNKTTEAHLLTPSSCSDIIDSEDMSKPFAESQGTAELLEEIEYVLNKSDELQQQLSKDVHTSNIEVTDKLQGAIEPTLPDKTEDDITKNNIKTDVNINVENSKANTGDELSTSTSLSLLSTPIDRPESQEDESSIDSNIIATVSEITTADLDANSVQTELLSSTSIATPSEFDVSTIESSSVEKSVRFDERETTDKKAESSHQEEVKDAIDLEAKVTESDSSINTELLVADAAVAESVAEAGPITNEVENVIHTAIENSDKDSVSKSKFDVITSINTAEIPTDPQTTLESGEEAEQTQTVVVTKTEQSVVDKGIQKSVDNNKETDITEDTTKPISIQYQETDSTSTKIEECKAVLLESKVEFKTIEDAVKTADETETVVGGKIKSNVENQNVTNSEKNSDSEKENNLIVIEEGKQILTSTVEEAKNMCFSEAQTPILCGIRDVLRTPKQKEATSLHNLTETPKASTSSAAAVVENDTEKLSDVLQLLKTPHFGKIKAQTPQNTAENSKFTPRRSTRRRASAHPELTPTPISITETGDTPRRTTRRRASAAAEVNYTPQRVTRRRSSLALDNEGVTVEALTPIKRVSLRAKRPGTITDAPVAEDMGAIIEEDPKEFVQESTARQDSVEFKKTKEDVEMETNVHDIAEFIEETICEEVNAQEVEEQREDVVKEKINRKCENADKSPNEIEPIHTIEKLGKDVNKTEIATESQSQLTRKTKVDDAVADNSSIVSEIYKEECSTETEDITTDKTDKTAEILDESDYEYGKEVMEQSAATVSTDTQPQTPKTERKSVRIADINIEESPKTPMMVGMRELLKTPKVCPDTPVLIGVRDLVRTPKTTIASGTTDVVDDEERLTGLVELMNTPKVAKPYCVKVESTEEDDEPSTSSKAHSDFIGMRQLLKTPKHTSTPHYSGMREMLRTPKACSTPQLAGVRELMQIPKRTNLNAEYDDKNEELDQFFKTPRAKNIMIPSDPASAILEPSSDSSAEIMMAPTMEYDLHSSSQQPVEDIDIYKTPVSTRLTNVEIEQNERKTYESEVKKDTSLTGTTNELKVSVPEKTTADCDNSPKATTSKRNLSAEEAFDEMVGMRTILDDTPPQKVYSRKQQSNVAVSPFSATNVISDLPKTDIQEWVDNLEQKPESIMEEQEFTASTSILDASKATHDPIAASMYERSAISVNKDSTEEMLADMSAAPSIMDPLQPNATKTNTSLLTIVVEDNDTLRPVSPVNTEISGINLLDRTTESVFSEPLVVSDTESVQFEETENNEEETENSIDKSTFDTKNLQNEEEFPIMVVDSSDSEPEEHVKTIDNSDFKKTDVKSLIESVKPLSNEKVIELDDESTANLTTKPSDIHEEFGNFQAHKNIAGQHMRASTPNRSVVQPIKERRLSMGAEQLIIEVSIDVSLEKSRLTKEKSADATTAEKNLAKIEEESVETSASDTDVAKVIPYDENSTVTSTESKDNESDFSNLIADKSITSREKRGATPVQANKSHSQKIIQGRRLTLGAEQNSPNITINFQEEKLKLEQLNQQQPSCIDESPLERGDSFSTEAMEVVETVENTTDVKISASDPKETTTTKNANNAPKVDDENTRDVNEHTDREENENKIGANRLVRSLKETDKISGDAEQDPVQDLYVEVSSVNKDDTQTIANVSECSAKESHKDVMSSENIEENITDVCESPVVEDILTFETIKGDNVNKAESKATTATNSKISQETTVSHDDTTTLTLINEEEINVLEPKSEDAGNKIAEELESTNVTEINSVESTKEKSEEYIEDTNAAATTSLTEEAIKIPEENKFEIENDADDKAQVQSFISIVEIKSEEQNLQNAHESTKVGKIEDEPLSNIENKNRMLEKKTDHQVADNVGIETLESQEESPKVSLETDRDEFKESNIFDLTDELSNETPSVNTTQGVIFDLTEEGVESIVETNTAENSMHDEHKPHDTTESKKVYPEAGDANPTFGNAESTPIKADQEIVFSKEVPCQIEMIEETDKTTAFVELKASTNEMALDTNTSDEVEKQNNQTVQTDNNDVICENACNTAEESESLFLETRAISQSKSPEAQVHIDEEDSTEEPMAKSEKESTPVATIETQLSVTYKLTDDKKAESDTENTTTKSSTADELETGDNKYSNEALRTDCVECVMPEISISPTISPTGLETEIVNMETKGNKAIEEVCEPDNEDESPTKDHAVVTAGIREKMKVKTTAEIFEMSQEAEQQISADQEKSEIIEDSEEIGAQLQCSSQTGKENDEADIISLNADSPISHVAKPSVEPVEILTDEANIPKEESDKNTAVEKSDDSEVQVSQLINENEIDVSVHQTSTETNNDEHQIEIPTFSGKQQTTKRKVLKSFKQNEDEHICRSTIESKLSIEEEVSADAQTYVDTYEERKIKEIDVAESTESATKSEADENLKVAESGEDVSKISVEEVSDFSGNLETVEKEHETSYETRIPAKRRGRKPSRSKQTTAENVELVSTIAIEKTTPVKELQFPEEKKANTVTSDFEESSSGVVQAVATLTRHKTEPEFYTKINYKICLSESAETAHDVKTDKDLELKLPHQSKKSIVDDKSADQSEVANIAKNSALYEEMDATENNSKAEKVHEPRRARRIRKASLSSQCSVDDEAHLPTTSTRRRGGRRRADTPLEHIATEVTTSDAPPVKRGRQKQDKVVEDEPIEEIQVIQINESQIANVEEDVFEIGNTSEGIGTSKEDHCESINNDIQKAEDDQLEVAVNSTTNKEQNDHSKNPTITRGPNMRPRVAKTTDEVGGSVVKDTQYIDVDELSNLPAATKRGRRKQTLSESSQTSVTIENTESHGTKRRKRGNNASSYKTTINEVIERTENNLSLKHEETPQNKDYNTTIAPVLETAAKTIETDVSSVTVDIVKGDPCAVKTELKPEDDHGTVADTSKRTRNKRIYKASDISKSNKEIPIESNDVKVELHDQEAVVKLEEQSKKTSVASFARVSRRKKAETDDENHHKTEKNEVHKDERSLEKKTHNKFEEAEPAVVDTATAIAESVGGRRGRRGAAAVATVAINEVSSAHKRGALRGKSHPKKSQVIRKEDETDTKLQKETASDHDEMSTVVAEKKQHKSMCRRRISVKEIQASLGDTAKEDEGVETIETEDDAGSSTKDALKLSRKRRDSYHADEQQTLNNVASTSTPGESASAASTKQHGRRKRKDSHQNLNDDVVGDEPPRKRPLSRKRRNSSLESSIHEGIDMDMDIIHGVNTSSSSTTPQRPRRAAAAQDRNYDESSDAEAQVDLKRRIEKASLPKSSSSSTAVTTASSPKQRSPTTSKTPIKVMLPTEIAEITGNTTSTPILSTVVTTSRGRQRKPTARVQQYLEEERAKAETPKKRLLIGSAAIGETPTSQMVGTPARRTRKTSTVEMVTSEIVHTPARSRTRTTKALHIAETSEESRSEVDHMHSELETTHSSSHVEEKEQTTRAKVTKRPTRGRGKHPIAEGTTTTIENELSTEPIETTHCRRVGRAAKAAAAAALITDDTIGSHTKARGGRTRRGADIAVTEEVQPNDSELKEVRTEVPGTPTTDVEQASKKTRKAATSGRAARGGRGRKKQQDNEEDTDHHTTQHTSLADVTASSSDALQQPPKLPITADADDEHEDEEEMLTTEAADIEVAKSLAGAKMTGKKRNAGTRKVATSTASTAASPVPKRSRRRAVAASIEDGDLTSHLNTRAESTASSRSRKMVRFDAATPSSVASATMSVDTVAEEVEEVALAATAPTKRTTRSRRK